MSIKASKTARKAILVFADGQVFYGRAFGSHAQVVGNVFFNTAMSGYQEVLTNPSNSERILCFTYPHIGNYGINPEDFESDQAWAKAMIVRELPLQTSNFRSTQTLAQFAETQNIVGITEVDTRSLTHYLRTHGVQSACIMSYAAEEKAPVEVALKAVREVNKDHVVSTFGDKTYTWEQGEWHLGEGFDESLKAQPDQAKYHIVVQDLGVRKNILRALVALGARVTVVPAEVRPEEIAKLQPDAVYISSGGGEPNASESFQTLIHYLLDEALPTFAEGLGASMAALALGAQITPNKQAHLSVNHPVLCEARQQVLFTQQDHHCSIVPDSLPSPLQVTHRSLFDQTIQGYQHQNKPFVAFVGHPEVRQGSLETRPLLQQFLQLIVERQNATKQA